MSRSNTQRHLVLIKEDMDTLIARLRILTGGLESVRDDVAGVEIESGTKEWFYVPRVVRLFPADTNDSDLLASQ